MSLNAWIIETSIFRLENLLRENNARIVRAISMRSDTMIFQLNRYFYPYRTASLLYNEDDGHYTLIEYNISENIAEIKIHENYMPPEEE